MSELLLIPYIVIDGNWTIPDELMRGLYRLMVQEGTEKIVYYSGTVRSEEDFIKSCRPPVSNTVLIVREEGEPVGIGWLNNFNHSSAHCHWVCFKRHWGTRRPDKAIKKVLSYWFGLEADGRPLFNILLGIYPAENEDINAFAQRAGFTIVGSIPNLLYNYWDKRMVGAVISYIERGMVCHS